MASNDDEPDDFIAWSDAIAFFTCDHCEGTGESRGPGVDPDYCPWCDAGSVTVYFGTWLANLAAAAMLERAYRLGREQDDPRVRDYWRPGCQRPAP